MQDFDFGDYHERFSDYYQFIAFLGRGAFGEVVHAIDKYTGEEVAVKIIKKRNLKREYISQLRQEAKILASFNHPNIVEFKHMKET